ncbi:hypothetical protein [Raoultella ornithinolytica]|nr:hypothetical protein [Raoultella ornithinolytica]
MKMKQTFQKAQQKTVKDFFVSQDKNSKAKAKPLDENSFFKKLLAG